MKEVNKLELGIELAALTADFIDSLEELSAYYETPILNILNNAIISLCDYKDNKEDD